MIDMAARASLDQIESRLARIEAERESLLLLRDAWQHYLALHDGLLPVTDTPLQEGSPRFGGGPGAATAQATSPSVSEPASAARPAADVADSPQHLGSPATREASVGLSDAKPDTTASEGSRTPVEPAPDASSHQLGRQALGYVGGNHADVGTVFVPPVVPLESKPVWQPAPEAVGRPTMEIHNGVERWLCNRCPLDFPDREERDLHQETHPKAPDAGDTIGSAGLRDWKIGGVQIG